MCGAVVDCGLDSFLFRLENHQIALHPLVEAQAQEQAQEQAQAQEQEQGQEQEQEQEQEQVDLHPMGGRLSSRRFPQRRYRCLAE